MPYINNRCLLVAILLATPLTSFSKEISYDYIEGTYSSLTIDTGTSVGDLDGNGLGISGSFSVTPAIAITAGFISTNYDEFLGVDIDTSEFAVGITGHVGIAPNTDIYGNFSVLKGRIELSDGFTSYDDTDTGNVISAGIRFLATENIELQVGFSRVDIFDESDNGFGGSLRFYASEKFSLAAGYSTVDDVDAFSLNARLDFK